MSPNAYFKSLLIIILSFSLQVRAIADFKNFPDLKIGDVGTYVKEIQKVLNTNGFPISTIGQPGSQNFETIKFGVLTQKALKEFQVKYNITPATGNFASKTKAKFNEVTNIKVVAKPSKGTPVSYGTEVCSSITYYQVTLTFATTTENPEFPRCGKFANGEPWLVASKVIITNIYNPSIPLGDAYTGGAMINPVPSNFSQGYASRFWPGSATQAHHYDPALDVSLHYPFNLYMGDSLIVARLIGASAENDGGAYIAHVDSVIGFIVLDQIPPEGSFRPGLYGSDHTVRYNKNNIDYSILKNLPPVSGTLSQYYIESAGRLPALPWWAWSSEWTDTFIRPLENSGTADGPTYRSQYGREIAKKWSQVALWLNTNNTQAVKEKTMIQTIQAGIDLASYFDNGGEIGASGGHQIGQKFPLFLAAAALKDEKLIRYASDPGRFIEDQTTFFVQQSDVGRGVELGFTYTQADADVKLPEWGINHNWNPYKDDSRWHVPLDYRHIQWPAMAGQVLAADLMGLRNLWNHPATFAYTERFHTVSGFGDAPGQMWDAYKQTSEDSRVKTVEISPKGGDLTTAQQITMTTETDGAQIRYTTNGQDPTPSSQLYVTPISLNSTQTIKAIAYKSGMVESEKTTERYTFPAGGYIVATPVISSPQNNTQFSSRTQSVTISWNDTPNTKYNIRGEEYLDSTKTTKTISPARRYWENTDHQWMGYRGYVYIDNYPKRTIYLPVEPGRYYDFSITAFDKDLLTTYGSPNGPSATTEFSFSIASSTQTVDDSDTDGVNDLMDKCPATPSILKTMVNNYGCPKPILSTLKLINDIGTIDFTNIGALEIEDANSTYGKIRYTQPVNIFGTTDKTSRIDLGSYISILSGKVVVNTANASQFNKPATVTLYNIDMKRPVIMKDGLVYASSTSPIMNYDPVAKTLTFTADGF